MSPVRLPPLGELVNALEFEEPAKLTLPPSVFTAIAGGDRAAFERITFRPRMMVPTLDLDMSVDLLGEPHFTPILIGPVAEQRRFHKDAELATVRGASEVRAAVVVSSRSSVPIGEIVAQAKSPLWFAAYADGDARRHVDGALAAGCKVICLTVEPSAKPDWQRIETIRRGLNAPIVVKGVATVQDAKAALDHGAKGIVVSDHGGAADKTAPIEVLPSIVDTVAGRAAVIVDGGFRRGSDIAKALAFGANGVLLARPIMWALAAYGADGVRTVLELLQNDLARNMGALGAVNLQALTRAMVRVHRR